MQGGALDTLLDQSFYSLFALAQALVDVDAGACRLQIISNNMQDVLPDDLLVPAKATLIGPCRVIPQEHAHITCRSIDLRLADFAAPGSIALLAQALLSQQTDVFVALRCGQRWVQTFTPTRIPADVGTRLRERGVYLITGGMGGIGLALAEYLIDTLQARVVLVGRSPLPPREEWPVILAAHDTSTGVARRIQQIQALEARGGELLLAYADVADAGALQAAVKQTLARFGALHGVFHAAGVPGAGIIPLQDHAMAAQVLAPKVQGTLALVQAVQDLPLDFLALFSSLSSATGGGPGQIAYCAANAFLDAYARQHAADHGITIALSWGEWLWDAWSAGLDGFPEQARAFFIASRQKYGISFADGMESLRRILGCNMPHVYITTREITAMVALSAELSIANLMQRIYQQRQSEPLYPRPELGTSYSEPRGETEQTIAQIWSQVLGISPIGINDNFFELGGNSLLGIDLIARLRKALGADQIPAHVLYEAPTVASLADYVQQVGKQMTSKVELEAQAHKRRDQFRQFKRKAQVGAA
jgi:NAD(P)-dependent dehydrogenase (short-subunit alcohol dehydrogenase family)/acyl carrier protein